MGYDDKRGSRDNGRGYGKAQGAGGYGGERRGGSRGNDRPQGGSRGGKSYGDRGGARDDRPRGERSYRNDRNGDHGNRSFRDDRERSYGDRERSSNNRDRGYRDRASRTSRDDRGGNRDDRRSYGDRPNRADRDRDNRGPRSDRDNRGRSYGDRGPRNDRGRSNGPAREARRPKEPRVGTHKDLKHDLYGINGRGFAAYKDLAGRYAYDGFELFIDHVQADPFSSPSNLRVRVAQDEAGFPSELFDEPWRLVALEDAIVRRFARALAQNACSFDENIKGGTMSTSRPGPEVIKRTACVCTSEAVEVRFEASLPACNRSVVADELSEMLFEVLPRCVREALLYVSYDADELAAVAALADDQHALREALEERNLVSFVADGAVLPRESGISNAPLRDAVPFESPETLRATIELPHAGAVSGMAVPRGVTLIVGGGYHGKSTLLAAMQAGVYNHVAGDGREYVVSDDTAVKLRAEDGRSVRDADISLFINNLPNDADTTSFWTENASGSTSQAASTVEALEAGARTLLVDEDTSAANFMVRDELMQAVVVREQEPITVFVERMRDLYEKAGVSTVVVAGSSGAFFSVADVVIQMDAYRSRDITERVRAISTERAVEPVRAADGFALPERERMLVTPPHPLMCKTASEAKAENAARREGRLSLVPERPKAKVFGGTNIAVGQIGADMRFVEQMIDVEQAKALAYVVRWCIERDAFARMSVREMAEAVWEEVEREGLGVLDGGRYVKCGLAMPRKQEVFACLNRLRVRS